MIRRILTVCCVLALFAGSASVANASECCVWKQVAAYETVTDYVTKTVAYTRTVTLYDHCGKAYAATKVCYRDVVVPVQRTVAVTKWVKVCY